MTKRCWMLVAVAAAFIAGCGSNSSPSAPEDTVAPAAVLDVEAEFVQGTIEVTWSAGSEADLVGYRVYRSLNGDVPALAAAPTSNSYDDASIETTTHLHSYRYEIAAVDRTGNESPRVSTAPVVVGAPLPGRGTVVE